MSIMFILSEWGHPSSTFSGKQNHVPLWSVHTLTHAAWGANVQNCEQSGVRVLWSRLPIPGTMRME